MQYSFTPAARRALAYAAAWTSRPDCAELEAPALLLGLLAEPECRSALILARRGIDAAAVLGRWPQWEAGKSLRRAASDPPDRPGPELEAACQEACQRLAAYPQPLELATEHLLLGLLVSRSEVSAWLRERGLDPDTLEAEIHRIYGHVAEFSPLSQWEMEKSGPLSIRERAGVRAADEQETATRGGPANPHPNPLPEGEETNVSPLPEGEGTSILRVLDAAANRAREGLRVAEDYMRFVLDDRHLTGQCKQLRHDLAAVLAAIPTEHRLAARETQADVGTALSAASQTSRENLAAVLTANFTRLQEALRSLEEFTKLPSPLAGEGQGVRGRGRLSAHFEQLRYRTYTLQRAVEITRFSLQRLAGARLYVLTDGRSSREEFERLARSLIGAGVHVLQLRDKTLDDGRLLERARLLRGLTAGAGTLLIMNDRPDLAVLSRADGVHVGQEELSVKDARTIVGPEALIGVSTHSIQQARQAVLDGANYIGVGPVFPSGTKRFDEFPGLDLLRAVVAEIRLPAFAIGGITLENLPDVLATGFTRVAVSGAILDAADPPAGARAMLIRLR